MAPFDVERPDDFDWTASDWTVTARIKTRAGGTILCQTKPEPKWAPDGKTIFVRGGKLGFDIGWVGVVMGRKQLDDDAWHDIAVTWKQESGRVRLVVDGKVDAEGVLKPKNRVEGQVVRIGYTAADFPNPSLWKGGLTDVRFYQRALADGELAKLRDNRDLERDEKLLGRWNPDQATGGLVRDLSSRKHDARATIVAESADGAAVVAAGSGPRLGGIAAAVAPATAPVEWRSEGGRLILKIAAGTEPPFEYGIICCAMRKFTAAFSRYYATLFEAHPYARPTELYQMASVELARAAVIARDRDGLQVVGFDLAGEEKG
ncbi:MAG TPA: hypothetical protein PLV92_30220, partial [Pirellulaceae bacterium]|nr:hypothetical protein [Pirellulaceae bacterium]